MQSSSLLLGRPWEFDTDDAHHGRTNTYSFVHKDKKLLCFFYRQLILGNILKSLLKILAINLLMLKQMELNWKDFILLLHLLMLSFVIIMMHLAILCFVDMNLFQMLLCLAQCILLSLTFCRRLIIGWSRGRLQFKKGRMMRTSLHRMRTRWCPTRLQLGLCFLLRFQKQHQKWRHGYIRSPFEEKFIWLER